MCSHFAVKMLQSDCRGSDSSFGKDKLIPLHAIILFCFVLQSLLYNISLFTKIKKVGAFKKKNPNWFLKFLFSMITYNICHLHPDHSYLKKKKKKHDQA